jgi:hypothetical protein
MSSLITFSEGTIKGVSATTAEPAISAMFNQWRSTYTPM